MQPVAIQPSTELRQRLSLLESERALAGLEGLDRDPLYMADLLDEIAGTRAAYVGSAVTEIASLEAALRGRNWG